MNPGARAGHKSLLHKEYVIPPGVQDDRSQHNMTPTCDASFPGREGHYYLNSGLTRFHSLPGQVYNGRMFLVRTLIIRHLTI
ncbi:uncharactized protein [Erwinia pyrifoliae Ep1/96]|nr:uncharactized protein [Erwinia pyrifoliae Ep1/96]